MSHQWCNARYPGIDYEYAPSSYWADTDVLSSILRNVKGRERREMIRYYYEHGRLDEIHESFLRETLGDEERERLGAINPIFMGGEYLPEYRRSEVEIARIELDSTTRDVISIRARKNGDHIRYSVVDEYNTYFQQVRKTSVRPLTLGQLVHFMDHSGTVELTAGLGLGYNVLLEDSLSRGYLRNFTRITSEFYHGLCSHYANVFDEWIAEGSVQDQAESV